MVAVGSSIMAFTVGASRTAIANSLISNFEQYSVIQYDEENNAEPPFGWSNPYYPRWVPEGFTVSKVEYGDYVSTVWYKAENNRNAKYSVYKSGNAPAINSENMIISDIVINNVSAKQYLSADRRYCVVVIPLIDWTLSIEGNMAQNQIIDMMKSIKF